MANRSIGLSAYRRALGAFGPLANLVLHYRVRKNKEDPARIGERRGRHGAARPPGPLVWLHAASVGEFLSILPLIEAIGERGFVLLVTTGTVTSAKLADERLPQNAIHQYVPLDVPRYVRRFLAHWRPDMAIFAESELWPNLLEGLRAASTPVILVNARMSERSFRRWGRARSTIGTLLNRIDLCLAQSDVDAKRLESLGAPRVVTTGNLKFDVPPPPADSSLLQRLKIALGHRPVLVAASTHSGEEAVIAEAHQKMSDQLPDLLTIIVPRHPERGYEAGETVANAGLSVATRSFGEEVHHDTQIYIADTIGELGLFYRLANVVFMGGSLVPHGGQNPIEPAKLGVPVLHGPHIHNFTAVYESLDRVQGALTVVDGDALAEVVTTLVSNEEACEDMRRAAAEIVIAYSGALGRTVAAIDPYLMQLRLGRT
ncbi:3-deoxy-D-manno-octulosonic acid transferase [Agaricicola taiwanensis]|uniref:3-deoxy-D-manno-octulosonic acid transferase n=1 Tax=Agaricicola taiwanensis TaxID=591372 RepID=A0A8J2YDL0_9RHOB|nr:3-deoxy-D-manno-octulosonic acid transferase [Agaricicola taiwanensis]GGE34367.1 3-deoxy-D-manno-octulosonic acid transferase [Agaricicola taiwanensis]